MSIVVAVRVGEGLVIAADSASTLLVSTSESKKPSIAKIFNHATKLMQLRDYPIAVASWGIGNIGARTISSLVEEYANDRPPLERIKNTSKKLSVEDEAKGLMDFLTKFFTKTYPKEKLPKDEFPLGVIVGGYSDNKFFPDEFVFSVPHKDFNVLRESKPDGHQNFGANWFGLTDAIIRFHHGRDDKIKQILQRIGVKQDDVNTAFELMQKEIQYPVPFDGMPLQDAVDYAMYLVGIVVGRYRFTVGPELCGGPIDVAAITREKGFQWVHQKRIIARPFGPQLKED